MSNFTQRAVAGVIVIIAVAAIQFSGLLEAGQAPVVKADPSVPPAGVALAGAKSTEGNVQDLTY